MVICLMFLVFSIDEIFSFENGALYFAPFVFL